MRKKTVVILAVAWLVLLVAGVSSAITMSICGVIGPGASDAADSFRVTGAQYELIERYGRLDEVLTELRTHYYQPLNEDELLLGAVRGMLSAVGDPYTFYYTSEEMRKLTERSQGQYEGLGLLLSSDRDGGVRVLRVFDGSPAYEAGVLPGDVLTQIGGETVSGQTAKALNEAIDRIRQSEDPLVRLAVRRGGQILRIGMEKRIVRISRVSSALIDDETGYIAIYEFMGDDVTAFRQAAAKLKKAGVRALVIDLRSNPGGLLADVVSIADELMGKGLIVYTQDREGRKSEYYSDEACWDVDIAVLVNDMSASASEILAGALKDTGRAVIVGEKTYGKGIVQTLTPFREDGAGMQLTTAAYYTPSGRSIHGVGIEPDIAVALGEGEQPASGAPNKAGDAQLARACAALRRKIGG